MSRERHRLGRSVAVIGIAAVLTTGIFAQGETISAQNATPSATGDCRTTILGDQTTARLFDLSAFLPVTDLVTGMARAVATPGTAAPAAATPISVSPPGSATPVASPVAGKTAGAVDPATVDELRTLAFAVVNCTSQSAISTLVTMVSDTYLAQVYAGGAQLRHDDLVAIASVTSVPQQELIAFDNVQQNGDTISAEVIYSSGNQLLHERWLFVRNADDTGWLLDSEESLPALTRRGASMTSVTIRDNGMKTDPREVAGPDLVIHSKNTDSIEHEVLVLRLPEGMTTSLLLESAGPGLPEGVEFIGQITVPARGEALLPLIDLAPGNYVVVDMLLDANGMPYLASGLKARLIVT